MSRNGISRLIVALGVVSLMAACGGTGLQDPDRAASAEIEDSFEIEPASEMDRAQLAIRRDALGKEFLLQTSLINQHQAPAFTGVKSRVVVFEERNGRLLMFESTQGHTVTHDLPQRLLLAQFPIYRATEDRFIFDFNAGMAGIFATADWYAQDTAGSDYSSAPSRSYPTATSYIESATVTEPNRLVIRQIARLWEGFTFELRYYLQPYRPNYAFERVVSESFDRMGFFEIAPQLKVSGGSIVYASKWDSSRPIVFAISDNTPAEYRAAVRDGILYWNKAFGNNQIKVVDAPGGIRAPDPGYNMVQWVNWDRAGYAYADAQMDPRTGEILHAQVYLTSAFAFGGRQRARQILKRLQTEEVRETPSLMLANFESARLCDRRAGRELENSIAQVLASGADDATILKMSQDYVREVVAHEIGHTLGLRHNFAGSLATNFPLSERARLFKEYVQTGSAPHEVITSSSVMEYQLFEEGVLTGDQIARSSAALSYDQAAIRHLYHHQLHAVEDLPLFCTDTHVGVYLDCARFDTGRSPIEYAAWMTRTEAATLPSRLIERYIAAKTGERKTSISEVALSPKVDATAIFDSRKLIIKSLLTSARLLKIRRSYALIDGLNEEQVRDAEIQFAAEEIDRLGGLPALFERLGAEYAESVKTTFSNLVRRPEYRVGIGLDGRSYEFSDADINAMDARVVRFSEAFVSELAAADLATISGSFSGTSFLGLLVGSGASLVDHSVTESLTTVIDDRINAYAFATRPGGELPATITIGIGEPAAQVEVVLPTFVYPLDVRKAAARLYSGMSSKMPGWGMAEKPKHGLRWKEFLRGIFTVAPETLTLEKQPKPVVRWILENREISFY